MTDDMKAILGLEIKERERILEAITILEDIYSDLGPYPDKDKYISGITRLRLNDFFKFDDSE